MLRLVLQSIGVLGIAAFIFLAIAIPTPPPLETAYVRPAPDPVEVATSTTEIIEEVPSEIATEVEIIAELAPSPKKSKSNVGSPQPAAAAQSQEPSAENEVRRITNPYPQPSKSQDELDASARAAMVNIYCESKGGPLSSISGSGVFIDPKGVILTNAHVAQYALLASDVRITLQCFIRAGSPAVNRWKADILYFPAGWIEEHAADIAKSRPKGTGEHDYALLVVRESVDGSPLPTSFPSLPFDTREAIAFTSDSVLLAGYPTEFAGGATTRSFLYPSSVFAHIGDLLTFAERSVDLVSLGSVPLAQSGSSGGSVVNLWGYVVGIITTTSEGVTTAERELRAVTLSYIDRNIQDTIGGSLSVLLSGDVRAKAAAFMRTKAPQLAEKIISHLP